MTAFRVTGQSFARELISATFIIIGPTIYREVGYPEMTTILASVAVLLGFVVPLFWKYGPRIRERSNYSQEASREMFPMPQQADSTSQIKAAARKEAERARLLDAMDQEQTANRQ